MENLEKLSITFNPTFFKLPDDIGLCENLNVVRLKGCPLLRSLPNSFSSLTLKRLIVDQTFCITNNIVKNGPLFLFYFFYFFFYFIKFLIPDLLWNI